MDIDLGRNKFSQEKYPFPQKGDFVLWLWYLKCVIWGEKCLGGLEFIPGISVDLKILRNVQKQTFLLTTRLQMLTGIGVYEQ